MDTHKVIEASMSLTITVGAVVGWLPSIAALLSILWITEQLYRSKSGQYLVGRIKAWLSREY